MSQVCCNFQIFGIQLRVFPVQFPLFLESREMQVRKCPVAIKQQCLVKMNQILCRIESCERLLC
jgi:hypothetical protein